MKKLILSVIAGALSTIIVIVIVASISALFYHAPQILPSEDTVKNTQIIFVHSSLGSLLGKLLAGVSGALSGGVVIALLKGNKKTVMFVAMLFSLLAVFYMIMIMQPLWFWILLSSNFIPFSLIGYSLASRKI